MCSNKCSFVMRMRKNIYKIRLIDKCLIVFMGILLLQTTYSLFAKTPYTQDMTAIDIVVRTTAAAIFGYFLSANFIRNEEVSATTPPPQIPMVLPVAQVEPDTPPEEINTTPDPPPDSKSGIDSSAVRVGETSDLQIIIATVIGVFSLCVLLYARNFAHLSAASAATVSQLRDFVSGCVGFLLGCPGKANDDSQQ